MELPIYLVGYMGAGKTTAGKLLADKLGWHFVDLDDAFEQIHGLSTADYIRQTLPSIRICGMRLKNCRSMMHRYSMNRRRPLPWDLDSAADSLDYCILRLFRSV